MDADWPGFLQTTPDGQPPFSPSTFGRLLLAVDDESGAVNLILPPQTSQAGKVLTTDGSEVSWETPVASGGTVTSVGLSAPNIFSVGSTPITGSGTIALGLVVQGANTIWAGPATGANAPPGFRSLVALDIPDLSTTYQPKDADLTAIAALTTDAFGRVLLTKTTDAAVRSYIGAGTSSFDGVFASLSSKPTTIGGYGITDFNSLGDARWSLLAHTHTFASLTSKPTTISGFGITDAYTKTETDSAISSAVVGLLDDRGNYNASGNVFPSSGGSGAAGAILKGDLWTISVGGTLNGIAVTAGDVLRALADTPGQTGSNWVVTENNLGYVPVNSAGTLALGGFSSITGRVGNANLPLGAQLYDNAGTPALAADFANRALLYPTGLGGEAMEWGSGYVAFPTGISEGPIIFSDEAANFLAASFQARTLVASDGSTVMLDWSGDTGEGLKIKIQATSGDLVFDGTRFSAPNQTNYFDNSGFVGVGSGLTNLVGDDTAYDATSWNANTGVPTKNAVRDKFETLRIGTDIQAYDSGLGLVKPAVAVVATSNLTLSGEQTIDGITTSGSIVLATAQTTGENNGPWISGSGAWTRPTWYVTGSTTQAPQFLTAFVRLGTTYSGSTWRMTTAAVTIGTTSQTWVQTPISLATANVTGTLPVANGGTNIASYAIGDLLYASGSTTLSKLADVAAGSFLRSGGVTAAPVWSTTTLPNSAAVGDLLYASATNVYSNLADVAAGNVLISGGVTTAPSWGKVTTSHTTGIAASGANTDITSITGSAASLSISGQTGLLTFAGLASTNRIKTVRDAADTILELGGSYTPTGTWTNVALDNPKAYDSSHVLSADFGARTLNNGIVMVDWGNASFVQFFGGLFQINNDGSFAYGRIDDVYGGLPSIGEVDSEAEEPNSRKLIANDGSTVVLDWSDPAGVDLGTIKAGNGSALTGVSASTVNGVTDGSNAAAGKVGEYVSASRVVGSATALTTATPKTVTSISLTAGDWDVTAIGAITGASTGTEFDVAISANDNSMTGTVLGDSRAQTPTVSLAGADATLMIPQFRVNISTTTTYYLIVQETFTLGSPAAYGRISARRRR